MVLHRSMISPKQILPIIFDLTRSGMWILISIIKQAMNRVLPSDLADPQILQSISRPNGVRKYWQQISAVRIVRYGPITVGTPLFPILESNMGTEDPALHPRHV